jgi:hypothetical protein
MAETCAVTLIQRFGGALNLIHFHSLFLDGAYIGPRCYQGMRRIPGKK